jgi:hypothetical protein
MDGDSQSNDHRQTKETQPSTHDSSIRAFV